MPPSKAGCANSAYIHPGTPGSVADPCRHPHRHSRESGNPVIPGERTDGLDCRLRAGMTTREGLRRRHPPPRDPGPTPSNVSKIPDITPR
jgi:hypothetical protein